MRNLGLFIFIWTGLIFLGCTSEEKLPDRVTNQNVENCDKPKVSAEDSNLELKKSDDESSDDVEFVEESGEVGVEVMKEGDPCVVEKKKVNAEVENNKLPLVIEIPDADPLPDEEAMEYLRNACLSCHDSEKGALKSFWAMDAEITKEELKIDPLAASVYYSLVVKAKGITSKPRAMPDRPLTDQEEKDLPGLIKWFETEMPVVVASAAGKFGGVGNSVGVKLNFRCDNPVSIRKFLLRLTNDAFDRNPTIQEIEEFSGGEPERVVTRKDRIKLAKQVFSNSAWREEFMDQGLRKFAGKISGAGDILPYGTQLSEAAAEDLKEEFYQYLRKYIDKKSWKDILMQDSVMVSANTYALYEGCEMPSGNSWGECDLKKPRGSYFDTVGYLRSKTTSFLMENNNYGRAALMQFIISGDVFKAAFDGDSGGKVNDLPGCLSTNDWRGRLEDDNFAGFGAKTVPASGNLCQSCHIDRQMAAGAALFRPFNKAGLIYGKDVVLTEDEDFIQATEEGMVNRPDLDAAKDVPVDETFLSGLLAEIDDKSVSCVPGTAESGDVKFKTVEDLAKYIIGDGRILAGGLARHMPRSMSNLLNTTEEIIVRVNEAYNDEDNKGMLIPVFEAYFSSETFACESKGL